MDEVVDALRSTFTETDGDKLREKSEQLLDMMNYPSKYGIFVEIFCNQNVDSTTKIAAVNFLLRVLRIHSGHNLYDPNFFISNIPVFLLNMTDETKAVVYNFVEYIFNLYFKSDLLDINNIFQSVSHNEVSYIYLCGVISSQINLNDDEVLFDEISGTILSAIAANFSRKMEIKEYGYVSFCYKIVVNLMKSIYPPYMRNSDLLSQLINAPACITQILHSNDYNDMFLVYIRSVLYFYSHILYKTDIISLDNELALSILNNVTSISCFEFDRETQCEISSCVSNLFYNNYIIKTIIQQPFQFFCSVILPLYLLNDEEIQRCVNGDIEFTNDICIFCPSSDDPRGFISGKLALLCKGNLKIQICETIYTILKNYFECFNPSQFDTITNLFACILMFSAIASYYVQLFSDNIKYVLSIIEFLLASSNDMLICGAMILLGELQISFSSDVLMLISNILLGSVNLNVVYFASKTFSLIISNLNQDDESNVVLDIFYINLEKYIEVYSNISSLVNDFEYTISIKKFLNTFSNGYSNNPQDFINVIFTIYQNVYDIHFIDKCSVILTSMGDFLEKHADTELFDTVLKQFFVIIESYFSLGILELITMIFAITPHVTKNMWEIFSQLLYINTNGAKFSEPFSNHETIVICLNNLILRDMQGALKIIDILLQNMNIFITTSQENHALLVPTLEYVTTILYTVKDQISHENLMAIINFVMYINEKFINSQSINYHCANVFSLVNSFSFGLIDMNTIANSTNYIALMYTLIKCRDLIQDQDFVNFSVIAINMLIQHKKIFSVAESRAYKHIEKIEENYIPIKKLKVFKHLQIMTEFLSVITGLSNMAKIYIADNIQECASNIINIHEISREMMAQNIVNHYICLSNFDI